MDPWLPFSLVIAVILSALFSSAETALVSLPPVTVARLIAEGRSKALKLWRDRPVRTLITILIGNNIVNVTAASLATLLAEKLFHATGVAIAIGGITLIILIAGEITPKSLARIHAPAWAVAVMPVIALFYILFLPATLLLMLLVKAVSPRKETERFISDKDLLSHITLASKIGALAEERATILTSTINLKDRQVRDIMVPRPSVVLADISESREAIIERLRESGVSRLPITRDHEEKIAGILHGRDLLTDADAPLESILHPVHYIPENKNVLALMKEMQNRRFHIAIVVDEFGTFVGLITLEDIIEEMVGEIVDEFDREPDETIRRDADGTYHLVGACPLYLVRRVMGLQVPMTGDYETIAGFLVAQAGTIPPEGTEISWGGWRFTIVKSDARRIIQITVAPDGEREDG